MLHKEPIMQLTPAEEGIWNGSMLYSDEGLYNAAEWLHIKGQLDLERFVEAVDQVYRSAVSINSRIFTDEAGLVNKESVNNTSVLTYLDYSSYSDALSRAILYCEADHSKSIELDSGKLYRIALIRIAESEFVFYQCIHHIANDGYGFHLLIKSLFDVYNGKNVREKPIFGGWSRFLEEEVTYLESEKHEADEAFWREHMGNLNPVVTFSESKTPPQKKTYKFRENLTYKKLVNAASRVSNATWVDFVHACVGTYLAFKSGLSQVTLGVPSMGRMGSKSANVPGMVMNILPLKLNLEDCVDIDQAAQCSAKAFANIRPHARFRYESMRGLVNAKQSTAALFGPVVNVLPFQRNYTSDQLDVTVHSLTSGPVEDVSFLFVLKGSEVELCFEANAERYSYAAFALITQELKEWISVCIQRNASLKSNPSLSLISGPEIQFSRLSVPEKIYRQACVYPDKVAIEFENSSITFRELVLRVNSEKAILTSMIGSQECTSRPVIVIAMSRSIEAISLAIACLSEDIAFSFIDPNGPKERNCSIVADLKPNLLIHQGDCYEYGSSVHVNEICNGVGYRNQKEPQNIEPLSRVCEPADHTAYIIYTSGSTGAPKGIEISHRSLSEFIDSANRLYKIQSQDRVLQFAPLQFDACIEEIFITLSLGGTLCIRDEAALNSTNSFIEYCEKQKITVLDLPTAFWHEWVRSASRLELTLPSYLTTVIIGGEAALDEITVQWHKLTQGKVVLWNTYGPSEATVVATAAKLVEGAAVSIGLPLPGRKVAVVSQSGKVLPKGEIGELVLFGSGVGKGYINHTLQNKMGFCQIPFYLLGASRCYRTGDLVRFQNGVIEYIGRVDDEIKISGHRISPTEIENTILKISEVSGAFVTMVKTSSGLKHITAFVESINEQIEPDVRKMIKQNLPETFMPSIIFILSKFPVNRSGKIDSKALKSHAITYYDSHANSVGKGDVMSGVVKVWEQVLGTLNLSVDDDFFEKGGTSLKTIQLANGLSEVFSCEISVSEIFECPIVFQQIQLIDAKIGTNPVVDGAQLTQVNELTLENWGEKASIPSEVTSLIKDGLRRAKPKQGDALLLTGATGFLGRFLAKQIIDYTTMNVILLVRAPNEREALEKLTRSFSSVEGLSYSDQRVTVLCGDLSKSQFGLDIIAWEAIKRRVQAIIHGAANTSVMQDYSSLKAVNADSVVSLVELAAKNKAPIISASTISVLVNYSDAGENSCNEDFIPFHSGLKDGYQKSKWHAEYILEQANKMGLPVSVFRLGRIVGDKETCLVNKSDLVWRIIIGSIKNSLFPKINISEPWLDASTIAKIMVRSALDKLNGQAIQEPVFNLTGGDLFQFDKAVTQLATIGYDYKTVTVSEWVETLLSSGCEESMTTALLVQSVEKNMKESKVPLINRSKGDQLVDAFGSFKSTDHIQDYIQNLRSRGVIPDANLKSSSDRADCELVREL